MNVPGSEIVIWTGADDVFDAFEPVLKGRVSHKTRIMSMELRVMNLPQHFYKVSRYCPAKWIRLKLGSFDRYLLKREARRFLDKSARLPTCESPLKTSRNLAELFAVRILATRLRNSLNSSNCRNKKNVVYSRSRPSHSGQYRWAFIVPLQISGSAHWAVAYRENQHSGY